MQNGQEYNPYKVFVGIFIPNLVIQDHNLSPGAKITFGIMCQFAGKKGLCFPRQEVIAERMGVSKRQVINYLNELKKEKYIRTSRRGIGKANIYRFLWKKAWTDSSLMEVNDSSHLDMNDSSLPIYTIDSLLNRHPPISPLKRGKSKTSYLKRERKVKRKEKLKGEDLDPKIKEKMKEIDNEWKRVVKPRILKEQIKKKEKYLNFEELSKLDQTRINFIGEKIKELRSG